MKTRILPLTLLAVSCALPVGHAQILKEAVPDKTVVLTFDDSPDSLRTVVAPFLKQYGFPATFYVTEFNNFADKTKYMTWEQQRQLNEMGFEIGNHTAHHDNVPNMTPAQFNESLAYIENKCIKLGIPKPLTMAYPAYAVNAEAIPVLKERGYIFARIDSSRPYDPVRDNPFLIPSWQSGTDNREVILEAFRQARDGKITVITFHGIPDRAHPNVTTPPELFEEYLQFLRDNKYNVVSMRDLAKYIDVDMAMELPVVIPTGRGRGGGGRRGGGPPPAGQ